MDINEKWTFKQKHKEEGASHVGEGGESVTGRRNNQCKPKKSKVPHVFKNHKETIMSGAEGREIRMKSEK